MRLALYNGYRPAVVVDDGTALVDVTGIVGADDLDPLTAGWWRALCRDWPLHREALAAAEVDGARIPLAEVELDAPALAPSKILASASNYRAHVAEMHEVQERTLGEVHAWMMEFDVFLKSPSSLVRPAGPIVLPQAVLDAGQEIHHESELVIVIGKGGKDIPVESALDAVLGLTAGLDITVRSPADRSRRKSYDTFSPLGPWIRVLDDGFDGSDLDILLTVDGETRQQVNTADLITSVPEIVSYASRIMTLNPGDLLFTGAPPGVGPIRRGETLVTTISGIGTMSTAVV
jgi:2-keto-4-pentenoate hydratase/2-oxohepta-3-ene-1,7-dioic acid hydratase in catechol pathway